MLHADGSVSVDSTQFWYEAYSLRRKRDGSLACPDFLSPLIQGILSAGKSVVLLRTHQKPDLRFASFGCI